MAPKTSTIIFFLATIAICNGLVHHLNIKNDRRTWFYIENFGFLSGGHLEMTIKNFKIGGEMYTEEFGGKVGFIIKRTPTDSTAFLDQNPATNECLETAMDEADIPVYINSTSNGNYTKEDIVIEDGKEGFYNTYFISCAGSPVSFSLDFVQYNLDKNGNRVYLSAGLTQLPSVFAAFTVAYSVGIVVWIFHFLRAKGSKVNRVHHLMTAFFILKVLSLLFDAIRFHFIKNDGRAVAWDVLYFIFAFVKGVMLFVLIALLGSGWTFVKPFLADKDKKIFMIVIPLQLLDNIAMIVVEETAPGSSGWFTWKDIFRLVDIICCGAILIPIIWSIKHLREAAATDGKAARSLKKLTLFRQFYLMVVSYIYFTRIIVYLVDATLPFKWIWLGDFFSELATLLFLAVTAYKFSPTPENPYFSLDDDRSSTSIPL